MKLLFYNLRNLKLNIFGFSTVEITCYHTKSKIKEVGTDWLTPWSRVLLQKLTVTQLVKKFPTFYGTRRIITVFIRSRHWSLSWARWIQSTTFHHVFVRFILIVSSHLRLGLPSCLFPSDFRIKIFYAFLISPMRAMPLPCHPPWFDHPNNNTYWIVQVMRSSLSSLLQPSPTSFYLENFGMQRVKYWSVLYMAAML
jgi:hypothetical protein